MEGISVHTDKASHTEEDHAEMADQPSDVEINEVARRLLRWKFLLSALEVHCELCERGRELPLLRDFFSNPGNFETNSRYDGISISSVSKFKISELLNFRSISFGVQCYTFCMARPLPASCNSSSWLF